MFPVSLLIIPVSRITVFLSQSCEHWISEADTNIDIDIGELKKNQMTYKWMLFFLTKRHNIENPFNKDPLNMVTCYLLANKFADTEDSQAGSL